MTKKEIIIKEIEQLPESYLDNVINYLTQLKSNIVRESSETIFVSETSLKKDWLKPEEEEAWKDL
ncbi:DUF2281 domain-containing protein [Bacteroidota bacterium]